MEDKKSSVEIKDGTSSSSKTEWYSYGDPPRRVEVRVAASVDFTYDASTGRIINDGVARFSYSVVNAASHEGITAAMTSDIIEPISDNIITHHVIFNVAYRGDIVAVSSIDVTCSASAI